MSLTPQELHQLAQAGIDPGSIAVLTLSVGGVQQLESAPDPQGNMGDYFAFIGGVAAGMVRAPAPILGSSGEPIAGGLAAAFPVPPTVRVLVRRDCLAPSALATLEAQERAARVSRLGAFDRGANDAGPPARTVRRRERLAARAGKGEA